MSEPTVTTPESTVRDYYDQVWNQRQLAQLDVFATPDVATAVHQAVSWWTAGFPDLRVHVEEVFRADDRVVARVTLTGTHTGNWTFGHRTFEPTQRTIRIRDTEVFRFEGGRISAVHDASDPASVIEQISPHSGQATPRQSPAVRWISRAWLLLAGIAVGAIVTLLFEDDDADLRGDQSSTAYLLCQDALGRRSTFEYQLSEGSPPALDAESLASWEEAHNFAREQWEKVEAEIQTLCS